MTEIPDWAINVPPEPGVHNAPARQGQWEGMSQNQIGQLRGQLLESIISTITQALTGLFLPGPFGAAFDQLKDWADNLGELVNEALTSLFARIEAATGVDLGVLLEIFAPLNMSSPGAFFQSLIEHILAIPAAIVSIAGDVLQGILEIPEHLGDLLNKLREFFLGPNSPLNAFNIFGLLQSWNLPFLPISSLTNKMPNLLVAPGFTAADSIGETENANGWFWDDNDGRTDPGCARVDALAGLSQILQSVPIPVADGQKVKAHVWVKWQSLVYTGTSPITLDLVRFDAGGFEVGKTTLASIVSPAASSGGDWLKIDGGEYTIPDDTTEQVVIQFRCRETVSAGSIWWDDAELKKTNQTIPQNWILNLVPDLGGIRDWIQDVIDGIISAIRGIPFVGGTIAHIILELTGWREDTDDAAAQASDAYIGLGVTQKIIVATTTGTPLDPSVITTPADDDVSEALTTQTTQIVQQAAQIALLEANFEGVSQNGGISSGDLFEYVNSTGVDPALWESTFLQGTGAAGFTINVADGHNAGMTPANSTSVVDELLRYIGSDNETETNFQKVGVIIAEQMRKGEFGRRSALLIYMRMSADKQNWVRWKWASGGEISLEYRVGGGAITQLGATSTGNGRPPAAAAVYGVAGAGTNDRVFSILLGSRGVYSIIDTGLVTALGPKGFGWGQFCDRGYSVGKVTQFNANDNAPTAIPGTYLKVARFASAAVAVPVDTTVNVFDTVIAQSGIGWASGVATALTPGIYGFKVRIRSDIPFPRTTGSATVTCVVSNGGVESFLTGPPVAAEIAGISENGGTGVITSVVQSAINSVWGEFDVPMLAGDTVRFTVNDSGFGFNVIGTAEGGRTYITAVKYGV